MKRPYLTILVFVFFSCNSGQHIKVIDKWENGKNKNVLTFDSPNDTLTYLKEFYFENEQLGMKGKLINGKQEGLWEWWYENGNKKDEAITTNGFFTGQRKHWREDGTLKLVEIINGQCSTDCCDGKVIFYTEKGEKLIEYTQRNGKWNGEGIGYFPDGKIKRKFIYVNGKKNGLNYEYYPNGQISVEGNYLDDLETGKWIYRDSIGNISGYEIYKDGQVIETK